MLNLGQLLKPYKNAGAANAVLAPHDEHCFLTKRGHLGVALALMGIDGDCLTEATLQALSASLLAALSAFDENFRLYQYVLKHRGASTAVMTGRIVLLIAKVFGHLGLHGAFQHVAYSNARNHDPADSTDFREIVDISESYLTPGFSAVK
jgi:hypothetical protein